MAQFRLLFDDKVVIKLSDIYKKHNNPGRDENQFESRDVFQASFIANLKITFSSLDYRTGTFVWICAQGTKGRFPWFPPD